MIRTPSQTPNAEATLVRALGTRQLTANIFNYTVGSGIFALPAIVAAELGNAAPAAYLLCAVTMALVALVLAEAGTRVTITGGPYAYIQEGLGPIAGFLSGILVVVNDVTAAGAIAMLLASSVARLANVANNGIVGALAAVLLTGLAALNVRGVRTGARVIEISTIAKLIPLLFFVVVGVFFISPANLRVGALPNAGRITATAGTLLFAFTGIEGALLPSGEVTRPTVTIPRAAMLALASVSLLYLAVQAVAVGTLGPAIVADRVSPLATAAATFAGNAGRNLLLVGASVSMFGWLTGSLLAAPRGVFALARDGFLPRRVAAVHPRYRTPHVAIAAYAALAVVLALSGTFQQLAILSNIAALGLYFLCAVSVLRLRVLGVRTEEAPFVIPGGPTVPLLTCLMVAWVVSQTIGRREFVSLGILLVAAIAMYAFKTRRAGPIAAGT
ncbi:MAG TPA: amino acid permease [Gemmatimonadaceae bacterium]|nr:amino acid permease [Gemmatimonadaceae bacterium]